MSRFIKKVSLAIFLFIFSYKALALQLGQISVNSTQDQPLNAEIELIVSSGDDLDSLKVNIAGKDIYQAQSIERVPVHEDIKIRVIQDGKKSKLKLISKEPVLDPFLDLLIQIDSPKGRNFREYTVLLDPLPASESQVVRMVEPEPAPETKPAPEPKLAPEPEPEPEPEIKTVISKKGVTLYQIARNNNLEGVTLQQIVVGIYQTNPKAFTNENINGLEIGNKLNLPNKSYYENLSHVEATKILKKENDSWKLIKNKNKIKEVKAKEPVKEVKAKEPVKEVKAKEPVKQITVEEPTVEIDTKTFKSSISSVDDNITEIIIKDKEEDGLTTLHMLLLALLLISIVGLLVILSRKKRKASLLFDEELDVKASETFNHTSDSATSLKPTDRYIDAMNKKNKG